MLEPDAEQIPFQYQGPLRIFQEQRPIPELQAIDAKLPISPLKGGVSIGTGATDVGTLGGILRSKTGSSTFYGLTCGHVIGAIGIDVEQPAQCDHSGHSIIGKSVYNYTPKTKSITLCTKYDKTTRTFFSMDVSLIELNGTPDMEVINIGPLDGLTPASQLHPNLAVTFNGRSSGNRTLVLGAIGITNNVKDAAGDKYCFEHLVELKDPSVANLTTRPPSQAGDSGAWIIVQKSTTRSEWGGMLIGGDGRQTSYLLMAEKINDELLAQGYDLDVY